MRSAHFQTLLSTDSRRALTYELQKMPMRGLIKRDAPKLQASVHTPGAAGQLHDGACLRSFAVAGGAAAAHAHVRNEPIPRRLLSCGASSDAEAFIRWSSLALRSRTTCG